jgi:Ca-activated chloride channel homolog
MKTETRKTAVILGAAGALVAAAIWIDRSRAEGSEPSVPKTIAVDPARPDLPVEERCGGAPARATADLGVGKLGAALSAGTILRAGGGNVYAGFDLTTAAISTAGPRAPINLAIVIDRSGSMSGDRIEHAKRAAIGIVDRLGAGDRVALVQYDDSAQVVVSSIPTDRAGKDRLRGAIREMTLGGSTNLHGGMVLGRDEVQRTLAPGQVSRIILLSDGRANAGVVDPSQIADTARAAADKGVRITSVGLGLDYNEDLMEAIAEAGRGNYYFVKEASDLQKVVAGELTGIQATVATNVELRLRPACAGVEVREVIGYETRREGDTVVIPMADLFGNDGRKLLVSLSVPDRLNGPLGAIRAELSFRDATSGELRTAQVALGLEVSDDHVAASASIDKEVMAQVLKVQAAQSMRQAAQAYEQGDREGALQILGSTRSKLESDRGRYGISAAEAAPAMAGLTEMEEDAKAYAPGSAGGNSLLKGSKDKARKMSKGK